MNCLSYLNNSKRIYLRKNNCSVVLAPVEYSLAPDEFLHIGVASYDDVVEAAKCASQADIKSDCLKNINMNTLLDIKECWEQSYILLVFAKKNLLNAMNLRNLINSGAYINIQDDNGVTPLMYAAQSKNVDAVSALVSINANTELEVKGVKAINLASGKCRDLIMTNKCSFF